MRIQQHTLSSSDLTIPKESAEKSGLLVSEAEKKNFKLNQLLAICASKGTNINDAHAVFDMLPDIMYASDIIVSETLSPKDLSAPKMNIIFDSTGLKKEVDDPDILSEINRHFSEGGYYDLESKLYKFLEESLITTGAVPLMVLKKTEIDDFINDRRTATSKITTESLKSGINTIHTNIVQPEQGSILDDIGITVTDNTDILKNALLDNFDIEMKLKDLGMENAKTNYLSFVDIGRIADTKEGHPLVFKLPVESVIPVHVPGQPDKHVGYYVVCENGYPISHKKDSGEFEKLSRRVKDLLKGSNDMFKRVITINDDIPGGDGSKKEFTSKDYLEQYASKVREELRRSLENGVYRRELEVSSHEDAYQLMFHKSLDKKDIKVIYVPAGIINYIAFDYDTRGIGKSLMEKTKLFSTIRASMLMADIFGSIKNSIPQTNVAVTLDESDPDALLTLSVIKDKILRMTSGSLPIGAVNASDVFESLMKASINMTIDGGTAFPNTRAEVIDGQRQIVKSDSELNEQIKKMHISGLGTTPEKVDRSLEGDYAISTASTNFVEARRIEERQREFERHISEFIRNYIRLSGPLLDLIKKLGKDTDDTLKRLKFKLPRVDANTLSAHLEAYSRTRELVEQMVEDQLNENMLRDTLRGDININALDNIREQAVGLFMSRWARDQNIMTDILAMATEENTDIIDEMKDRMSNVIDLVSQVVKHAIEVNEEGEKDTRKVIEEIEENSPGAAPTPTDTGGGEPDIFDQPADDAIPEGAGSVPEDEPGQEVPEEEADSADTGGDDIPEPPPA